MTLKSYKDLACVQIIQNSDSIYSWNYIKNKLSRFFSHIKIEPVIHDNGRIFFQIGWLSKNIDIIQDMDFYSILEEYKLEFLISEIDKKIDYDLEYSESILDELSDLIEGLPLSILSLVAWQTERSYLQFYNEGIRGHYLKSRTKGSIKTWLRSSIKSERLDPLRYVDKFELDDDFYSAVKMASKGKKISVTNLKTMTTSQLIENFNKQV